MQGLMARGIPAHVAKGITANMIAESRLDPGINEIAPLVPGSRGGYGLNQWTGPRRRALEAAAKERGVPVNDLDFQLDYTLEELRGSEKRAMDALMKTSNAEEAARVYSDRFLRPGIPHMNTRLGHARRLAGEDFQIGKTAPPAPTMQEFPVGAQDIRPPPYDGPPKNALAEPDPRQRMAMEYANALRQQQPHQEFQPLDAQGFMAQPPQYATPQNAFAQVEYRPRYLTRR